MLHASADPATVRPAARARGRVRVPGDKSISHRYALLAALAEGPSTITGYSPGADCAATLACLRALGVHIAGDAVSGLRIEGCGLGGLRAPAGPLDAANSGTTMRLLTGILAAHRFRTVLTGDASLSRRPMRRVIEPLSRMGARIDAVDGHAPLAIEGAVLSGIRFTPDVPSAQVKSAILLAGLHAEGATTVVEAVPTRDHTERALEAFGVETERAGTEITVRGSAHLTGRTVQVPGDISGATFWAVLAAGSPDGDIVTEDVGVNPSRTAVLDVLRRAGADVEIAVTADAVGEPRGSVRVRARAVRFFTIEPAEVPGVIDEIPALAALAAMTPGGGVLVRGAAELRVKESDRISALARGFRALGADVEEFEDGFRLEAGPLTGGTVDAAGDHRLAMAFALAATRASSPVTIEGASAVDVSYPGFFSELARLTSDGDDR